MKAVILAGGRGIRLQEETSIRPKPLVEIGGKPILWHVMKIYSSHGINDFVICLGYLGYLIKEYFANYALHMSDVTLDISKGSIEVHENYAEPWRITLVETGEAAMTGGRLLKIKKYLDDEAFCMSYGDGLGDVDISRLVAFHNEQKSLATVTAVRPPARFGSMGIKDSMVTRFEEKPVGESGWINGGFFVLSPKVIDYIENDMTIWERAPLERLTAEGNLSAYCHDGFWHPMDILRDKLYLDNLWESDQAPWKTW
jgi:glucose-1-phosphate cytidylyltransferase